MTEIVDFLTHSAARIGASASAIWPYFLDVEGGPELTPVSGEPGQAGQRLAASYDAAKTTAYFVVVAELVPERRRTFRLEGLDGAFMGFVTWVLVPEGETTLALHDVYTRYPLPPGLVAAEVVAQSQRAADAWLAGVKARLES